MTEKYANDFFDIPTTLAANEVLREAVTTLMQNEPIPGKVLEGDSRLGEFRRILIDLANGIIDLDKAYLQTQTKIPRHTSPHSSNNRVFPQGWAERLIRIQFSRFYNQAVLEKLRDEGVTNCFVPHSDTEDIASPCTQQLAGHEQSVGILYQRLIESYALGNWSQDVKIPNHPHCTHVVKPIDA